MTLRSRFGVKTIMQLLYLFFREGQNAVFRVKTPVFMDCLEAFPKSEKSMVLSWNRCNFAADIEGKS